MGKSILFKQGKNFTVYKEAREYFLTTINGYEQEYIYLDELIRDINRGYVQDHYQGKIELIK